MKNNQNIILDFSHIYPEDIGKQTEGLTRIDFSDIGGTDMYCTEEAEKEIRRRILPYGPCGIHFLDSGNYHYVTEFFAEMIREPFSLVLYDHHSDMQEPLFPGMTSCGSWAGDMLKKNGRLRQLILAGPDQKSVDEIPEELKKRIVFFSREEIQNKEMERKIKNIDLDLPVYISIDKDVLDREDARTNWNQGRMPLTVLEKLLLDVFVHQQVIGADICGECSLLEPVQELMEGGKINRVTNEKLYRFLSVLFREFDGVS